MKKKIKKSTPVYLIIPLFLIAAVVPLIVRLKVIPIDDVSFNFWIGDKNNADFFSYYKAIFTIFLAALSLLMFIWARYKQIIETRQLIIYYIPIAIYAVMIVLSTLLSKYPVTARNGFIDRYEGAYVLLAYIAILFTTINLVNNEKSVRIMMLGLLVSALGIGIIGIFQFFGADLFKSDFGKQLILPAEYRGLNLDFTFGAHTIYSTLYNTNFVGSYTAMLLPLAFAAFLYFKDIKYKIAGGVFTCLMFATWLGCRSRAGYLGGLVALVALAIIMRKQIIADIKSVIPLFLSIVLIFIGMNYAADGELGGRIITTISNIGDYGAANIADNKKTQLLEDIVINGKKVSIIYGNNTLNMSLAGSQVEFADSDNEPLTIKKDTNGNIVFEDTRYAPYSITIDKSSNMFYIKLDKMKFTFYLDPNGFKIVGERGILLDKIEHPRSVGFEGKEKLASMRGYIWSRSIPLLANNIFVGGGPDTFVMQFPQHDYVGKLRAFDMVNEIVDKPHNLYLQIGINTGIISLLAVLFLFGTYLVSSLRLIIRNKGSENIRYFCIALFAAVLGYVTAGLANDSLVSVAPVFWIVLGLGISCNYIYENISGKGTNTKTNIKLKQKNKPA